MENQYQQTGSSYKQWKHRHKQKVSNALKAGHVFEIPVDDYIRLMTATRCYFTGVPLTKNNISLDRADNDRGYVKGNVVACDSHFNSRKGDLTATEIKSMYNVLKEIGAYKKRAYFTLFGLKLEIKY